MKIKGINIFEELDKNPKVVEEFDIVRLMNERPIPGGKYSSNDMGMTFELCNDGEIYMICQGSGGGYGDVLERDPELVMKDLREDLMSHDNAWDIYRVVYDRENLIVDVEATEKARAEERKARIQRGKPFEAFCKDWVTPEPPTDVPYLGSWDDNTETWASIPGMMRVKTPSDQIQGVFMPNPKDVRIAQLEAELELR